jgi:hypothetical protein
MAAKFAGTHTLPTVKPGAVICVYVPALPGLWTVESVLLQPGTWGYVLRISQRVDGMSVLRYIAPQGFEIIGQ